jgi:hypothetical protein
MKDLIPKTTDEELERYYEAEATLRARIPMEGNAALKFEHDPVTKRENAYFPLSSGGYVKIGDRAVTPEQAAETDVLAAEREIQNDARGPIGDVIGGAGGPTMEDYEAAGFTEAEVLEYNAQRSVAAETNLMAAAQEPGFGPAATLTEDQMQFGEEVGADFMRIAEEPPGVFEGTLSEIVKGLARGGIVEPSRFVKENFNLYDPLVFQVVDPRTGEFDPQLRIVSREEKAEIDRAIAAGEMPYAVDFEQLFETGDAWKVGPGSQIVGGISQFIGAFAGVGKIFRIGKGFIGASTQGAAADFLGFGGNDGRLTDLLLELGMPENVVTDLLKTDPNNPDYVGRIKNAFEGGFLGAIAEPIARTISMLARGGSRAELAQSIADLRTKSETAFSNGISDMIGTGRAIMQGDTEMLGEIFQPAGTPRSLGAAGTGVDDAALVGRTEEFLEQAAPDPETAGAITAFHGSPYDFDAFDISRMGAGEGTQAYGPGLYFAESEDVARGYRDGLIKSLIDGQTPDPESARDVATYAVRRSGNRERAIASLEAQRTQVSQEAAEYLKGGGDLGEIITPPGRLYEVNIRAKPEDFLNWDAPISQQSEKVREALMPFVEQRIAKMGEAGNRFTPEQWMDRLRGGDVMLLDKVGDTPVSRALIEAGVPGVRYLDAQSRYTPQNLPDNPIANEARQFLEQANGDTDRALSLFRQSNPIERFASVERDEVERVIRAAERQATRNIVVFDDQLIDIVKKYGVAGLAVGAAVQSELGGNQQIEENI